jgi:predicted RNA binding protein YcfA (HicA-like mRNA interferase family)
MKLPRDLSAEDLVQKLKHLGYGVTRHTGSHIRLTTTQQGEHHITIPKHTPLRVGTLSAILADIGEHFSMSRDECLHKLFE